MEHKKKATATGDGDGDDGEGGPEQSFEDVSSETSKCFRMS